MPQVISSVISGNEAQAAGRAWITESHTLADGSVRALTYLADPGFDINAALAMHAAAIEAEPDPVI